MAKFEKSRGTKRKAERERIRAIAKMAASGKFPQVAVGIGDDAGVLRVPRGHEVVITTDFSLEGVHFCRDVHSAESAGHRCLARGLSDIAAMGAKPLAAFLSLALDDDAAGEWADGFFRGLLGLAREYGIPLAGGDLTRSGDRVLADIVLVGSVSKGKALLRSSARAGDLLYVTGTLGESAAELARAMKAAAKRRTARRGAHFFPQPRIAAGLALQRLGMRVACMDISDGLAIDLSRMCEASSVAAEIDVARLPIARGATLQQALTGGEDYELLFAAPANAHFPKLLGGIAVTQIGRMVAPAKRKPQLTLIHRDGERGLLAAEGWEAFT